MLPRLPKFVSALMSRRGAAPDRPSDEQWSEPWLPSATYAARGRASATTYRTRTAAPAAAGTQTSSVSAPWSAARPSASTSAPPASRPAGSPARCVGPPPRAAEPPRSALFHDHVLKWVTAHDHGRCPEWLHVKLRHNRTLSVQAK